MDNSSPSRAPVRTSRPPQRMPQPLRNQFWRTVEAEGKLLFEFASSRPELQPELQIAFNALRDMRYNPDRLGRPTPAAQAREAIQRRRKFFKTVGEKALALYLARIPDPLPVFRRKHKQVLVAFKRQCVMDHFRRTHGNPFYREP
jgi:hypothetical protein